MDELRGGSKVEGRRCWLAVGVVNNEPGGGCLMLGCLDARLFALQRRKRPFLLHDESRLTQHYKLQ